MENLKPAGKSLVAGIPIQGDGEIFTARNPQTGEELSPAFTSAQLEMVEDAVDAVEEAFVWMMRSAPSQRADFLCAIAEEIEALKVAIVERAGQETGLPQARLNGELVRTTTQLRLFAKTLEEGSWMDARIDHAIPDRQPVPKPDLRYFKQALGPVVVFGASNFPLAFSVAGGDTASALAAGCPVIVKAHPAHPGTSELVGVCVASAVEKCGLPAGTFSLLFDAGKDLGLALVRHPKIAAVGFTGSRQAGLALIRAAQDRPVPIPVYAEMSSINPVLVFPQKLAADADAFAEGLAGSVSMGVGQFCTNPGLVLLPAGEAADSFAKALTGKLAEVAPAPMLHAGIAGQYEKALSRRAGLAETLLEGEVVDCLATASVSCCALKDFFSKPALAEEIFGPATLLVTYERTSDLMDLAEALEGQLTVTFYATESELAAHRDLVLAFSRKAGRLLFGGYPTGVDVCDSMCHGGPFPATSDGRTTSVGTAAIDRWLRPVCLQDFPEALLPPPVQETNPYKAPRRVDGEIRLP